MQARNKQDNQRLTINPQHGEEATQNTDTEYNWSSNQLLNLLNSSAKA